jgi:Domain of unknown function (DUF4383)
MEPASPARLYATLIGAILVVLGLFGFFRDLSWLNFLYVGGGALGLLLAGYAARAYALWSGAIFTVLAILGLAAGSGEEIVGLLPTAGGEDWLNLALGLLGLAAAAGTPRLEARAKAAAERP